MEVSGHRHTLTILPPGLTGTSLLLSVIEPRSSVP